MNIVYYATLPVSTYEFTAMLDFGEENAVSAAYLNRISGLTAREIRAETEAARRAGVPICTTSAGYYIALTESEKTACIERLRRQAQAILRTASALERARIVTDA